MQATMLGYNGEKCIVVGSSSSSKTQQLYTDTTVVKALLYYSKVLKERKTSASTLHADKLTLERGKCPLKKMAPLSSTLSGLG